MPNSISLLPDIKVRAEKKCTGDLAYLKVLDPGSQIEIDGKVQVLVQDQKNHLFWIEV